MNTARDESLEQLPGHAFPSTPIPSPKLSPAPPPEEVRGKILLVDDGSPNLEELGYLLNAEGYQVTLAATAQAALEALEDASFDLLIAPMARGPEAGLAVLKKARRLRPRMGILILAGPSLTLPAEAYKLQVDDYLLLPCRAAEFSRRVAACLEQSPRSQESTSRAGAVNKRMLNILRLRFHDLRSSLVLLDASLTQMSRGKFGKMDAGVAEKLSQMSRRVGHLIGMAEDFLGKTYLAGSDFLETADLDLPRDTIN
jgi:PleD family two-component response regulator